MSQTFQRGDIVYHQTFEFTNKYVGVITGFDDDNDPIVKWFNVSTKKWFNAMSMLRADVTYVGSIPEGTEWDV